MKELQVLESKLPILKINFEELKSSLKAEVEKYKGLVVTEETLPTCKQTQKEIASLRIKIDKHRKEIKQEFEKPIKQFEAEVKELLAIIDTVEAPIVSGIKHYDDLKRQEKQELVRSIRDEYVKQYELIPDIATKITLSESLYNITTNEKQIKDFITSQCINLKNIQVSYLNGLKSINEQINTMNQLYSLKLPVHIIDFRFRVDDDVSVVLMNIKNEAEKRRKFEDDLKKHDEMIAQEKEQEEEIFPEITPSEDYEKMIDDLSVISPAMQGDVAFSDFESFDENIYVITITCKEAEIDKIKGILNDNKIEFEVHA